MNRKNVFLLFIFLVIMSLVSNVVYASSHNTQGVGSGLKEAAETIKDVFGVIPEIITVEKLAGGDAAAAFWARFLIWILLFMIVFFGGSFVFKDNKNIQIGVAMAISLLGALGIPPIWILGMFKTYTLAASLIVFLLPVMGALYLTHVVQYRVIKILVLAVLVVMLTFIRNSLASSDSILSAGAWMPWFNIVYAVIIFWLLWTILTANDTIRGVGDRFRESTIGKISDAFGGGSGGTSGGSGSGGGGADGTGAGGGAAAAKEKAMDMQEIAIENDATRTLAAILVLIRKIEYEGSATAKAVILTKIPDPLRYPQMDAISGLIHKEVEFDSVHPELKKMLGIHTKEMEGLLRSEHDYFARAERLINDLEDDIIHDRIGPAKTHAKQAIKVIKVLLRINTEQIKRLRIFP